MLKSPVIGVSMKTLLTILVLASVAFGQRSLRTGEDLGGAKAIKAVIKVGAVDLKLKGTDNPEKAFQLYYSYTNDEKVPKLMYEVDGDNGLFKLSNDRQHTNFPFLGFGKDKDSVDLELANSVPVSLEMAFGVCDAAVDLGGMEISDASFSTGVCSFDLNFSTPNKIECDHIVVKTGISSVTVENLANAHAKTVEFNGGLGSMKIDFGGKLVSDCDVRIKTGLGSVDIAIPSDINTTITTPESFLTSVDVAGFYSQGGGVYRSSEKKGPKLSIFIDSAMGGVKIKSY